MHLRFTCKAIFNSTKACTQKLVSVGDESSAFEGDPRCLCRCEIYVKFRYFAKNKTIYFFKSEFRGGEAEPLSVYVPEFNFFTFKRSHKISQQ